MGTFRLMTQLAHLFVHTVGVSPWTGQNTFGEATYGAQVNYPCRIEPVNIRNNNPNQAIGANLKVFLDRYVQIDPRDKVVIPSAYGSRNDAGVFEAPISKLLEVKYLSDQAGPVCTVLMCGVKKDAGTAI